MLNSPTQIDSLITADYLLTMNADYDIFTPGAVAVSQDSIVPWALKMHSKTEYYDLTEKL